MINNDTINQVLVNDTIIINYNSCSYAWCVQYTRGLCRVCTRHPPPPRPAARRRAAPSTRSRAPPRRMKRPGVLGGRAAPAVQVWVGSRQSQALADCYAPGRVRVAVSQACAAVDKVGGWKEMGINAEDPALSKEFC